MIRERLRQPVFYLHRALPIAVCCILLLLTAAPVCAADEPAFEALSYPPQALTVFDDTMTRRVSSGDDHVSNRGYADETGLYVSPCWRCDVGGENVPVYAAMSYDYELDRGVPHSFACIWVKSFGSGLHVRLTSLGDAVRSALILPESLGAACTVQDGCVAFAVRRPGRYTCLINGDSQKDAFTLTVKEYTDEQSEIAAYRARYGEQNVAVYPKGYYDIDTIETEGKQVVYFCRGSFFAVPHHVDIRSDADAAQAPGQPTFFALMQRQGVTVTGYGTIDFNKVDRNERGEAFVYACKDTTVEGILFLNSPGWTMVVAGSDGVRLRGIEAIGYRTNSDAVNICGSRNVTVSDCFARNGDDCFSVKTTDKSSPAGEIRFENCIAWSNKARCYGITGEVEMPIRGVVFSDCAVIYRGATWDNDRVSSLAVSVETGGAAVEDIVFENIEIHHDSGRPINVLIYSNDLEQCKVSGLVFRNITASGAEKSRLATKRNASFWVRLRCRISRLLARAFPCSDLPRKLCPTANEIDLTVENVTVNGRKINAVNWRSFFSRTGNENVQFVG